MERKNFWLKLVLHVPASCSVQREKGASQETVEEYAGKLTDLMQKPVSGDVSDESIQAAEEWDAFCDGFLWFTRR